MNLQEIDKVAEEIKKRDHFLLTSHINPEGDSIGSQIGLAHILEAMGKKVVLIDQDEVPDNLRFLPGSEKIEESIPPGIVPQVVVFLDCPVKERVGNVIDTLDEEIFMINMDHHISNEYFADVNWVEAKASSVGEMTYHLAKKLNVELTKEMAMAMYTAIITDTGMFNHNNTSDVTHEVIADLLRTGIKPADMYENIFENKSLSQMKILGKVLSNVEVEYNGQIASITLTRQMHHEEGIDSVPTEEFINFPRSIKGVKVTIFFNEGDNDLVNVSFRSKGKIPVNELASSFGGGGHVNAAGCMMKGSLDEVRNKVIDKVKSILKEND